MKDRAKWSGSLVIAVPTDAHEPIEQCAVLLTENQFASQFLKFLGSDKATETTCILRELGVAAGPFSARAMG